MFMPLNLRWPFMYANPGVSWPRGYLTTGVEGSLPLAPKPIYSGGITLSKDAASEADDPPVSDHEEAPDIGKKLKVDTGNGKIGKGVEAGKDKVKKENLEESSGGRSNEVGKDADEDKDGVVIATNQEKSEDAAASADDSKVIERQSKAEDGGLGVPLMNSLPFFLQQPSAFSLAQLQQAMRSGNRGMEFFPPWPPAAALFFGDYRRLGRSPYGKKYYNCPQCRYMTDRKNNLKRHVSTMHQECDKLLDCCGLMFKNKASLRDHVLIFHRNGYMCRFCGRNFCRKALLKRHLTVHSGQKDYVCSICDYATSHKSNLERHRKVHERQLHEAPDDSLPVLAFNPTDTSCMGSPVTSDSRESLPTPFSLHTT
ncbi:zinc finger and BTB domain-containing protein 49-like [Lingula anatina]|uniref:Zinc finger and BTB domain-containing protein 49-like n=1 Tax=Lingula anatina TaxID=7574 RepID=A0A1S3I1Z0_LINAN|nr:zinc finger and BTB domain-containing protein 49-like [Lingula anatina]|eukprot:XP_013391364.2 zinc finger and BTB domain-containing protein 49-like [Lingula anatina]